MFLSGNCSGFACHLHLGGITNLTASDSSLPSDILECFAFQVLFGSALTSELFPGNVWNLFDFYAVNILDI